MLKNELISKSPVRILEKSIRGGLEAGGIGVIASRKGIGKTSVLVQLAMDRLLQDEKIIHVSFTAHTSYVISWYENIFTELAKRKNLEQFEDVKSGLIRNRVIMNFIQEGVTTEQIIKSLRAMIVDGGFPATTLIIDGLDFSKYTPAGMDAMKKFAQEMNLVIWYSANLTGVDDALLDSNDFPVLLKGFVASISVMIVLVAKPEYIHFVVVKDHEVFNPQDLHLKLDSKTLLISDI